MDRRKFLTYIGCGCGSIFLHSCSSAPITDRKQLKIIPEAKLNAQAAQIYEKVKEKEKMSDDLKTLNEIKEIGKKMEDSISEYFYRSNLQDPTVNFDWEYILIEKKKDLISPQWARNIKCKNNNIINIIDQRVFKLTPFFYSYTISKTGLYTLTKTSAMSLAPNIRVNGIAPGPTLKNKRQSEKHFKKQYMATPLKRKVDVEQICSAVDFFIKNRSITGQVISIDSGQSLNWQTPDIMGGKE